MYVFIKTIILKLTNDEPNPNETKVKFQVLFFPIYATGQEGR